MTATFQCQLGTVTYAVLNSPDHEHYRVGQIVAAVGDCFLIQFDQAENTVDDPPPPLELYTVDELSDSCENCGQKLTLLFKSRAEMERWIAWVNEPEKPTGDGKGRAPEEAALGGDSGPHARLLIGLGRVVAGFISSRLFFHPKPS